VPWKNTNDARDGDNPQDEAPLQSMTLAYISSKGDGTSKTMLFSESLAALYYSYTGEGNEYNMMLDANYHFGFTWVQPNDVVQDKRLRVNGSKEPPLYTTFGGMSQLVPDQAQAAPSEPPVTPRPGIASSFHPGGVNVAFVGSQVTFVTDQIEPFVFAQLMTSNHKQSGLVDDATSADPEDGSF
jgi:hypothetical protein